MKMQSQKQLIKHSRQNFAEKDLNHQLNIENRCLFKNVQKSDVRPILCLHR